MLTLESWRFERQHRRLHRQIDEIAADRTAAEATARARGASSDELEEIAYDHHFQRRMVDDEINELTTKHYIRVAHRLLLPIPEFESDAWVESEERPGRYHLTRAALNTLRSAIRAEQKARREEWTIWLTSLVGVIGALSGLVAIIKK